MQKIKDDSAYTDCWALIRGLQVGYWFLLWMPLLVAAAYLMRNLLAVPERLWLLFALVWGISLMFVSLRLFILACPSCEKLFFFDMYFMNPFQKKCKSCGIEVGQRKR